MNNYAEQLEIERQKQALIQMEMIVNNQLEMNVDIDYDDELEKYREEKYNQ